MEEFVTYTIIGFLTGLLGMAYGVSCSVNPRAVDLHSLA